MERDERSPVGRRRLNALHQPTMLKTPVNDACDGVRELGPLNLVCNGVEMVLSPHPLLPVAT